MTKKQEEDILKLPFVQEALRQAEIAAFPKAQKDILETMRDDLDKESDKLAQEKLAALLTGIDFNKVITHDQKQGFIYIAGERAEDARLVNLKNEDSKK